jgi:hypothetical protein
MAAVPPARPLAASSVLGTVSIPLHACWWPITGAASLFVETATGDLYRVPDTHDTVPRDYDHALSIPPEFQRAILGGRDEAWPATIDPKCIVVVRARGMFHSGAPTNCTYWFARLSCTPQILRRVPASVRARLRKSLLQCAAFTQSTLITEYMDTGADWRPELQAWVRCSAADGPQPSAGESVGATAVVAASAASAASPKCAICLAQPPQRVLIPCGHAVLCARCAVETEWRRCPVCRSNVQHVNMLFP